jgi:hypothetical protein
MLILADRPSFTGSVKLERKKKSKDINLEGEDAITMYLDNYFQMNKGQFGYHVLTRYF